MATTTHRALGRNDPCHCGSGRKYKHCCLEKDEAAERTARAEAEAQTSEAEPQAAEQATPAAPPRRPKHQTQQPWKRATTNTHGFQRMSAPRKIGSS